MQKLRVGIIGIGEIGTTKHLTQLVRHADEVEVAALCDIIPERCEQANEEFGLNAKIYTDYNEICADETLDVIHVCTPNPLHCEMTLKAFEHGKHVYCEKPLACTWEDAQKMLAVSNNASDDEVFKKASVIGALELYLDFINIFLAMLRLFGRRRD